LLGADHALTFVKKWQLRGRGQLRRPFRRLIVVVAGSNPTFDYYLAPRLRTRHNLDIEIADLWKGPDELSSAIFQDALVLFCRYISGRWLDAMERNREKIAGVGTFLDDDLVALFQDWKIPVRMRARYLMKGIALWPRLERQLDVLILSNPRLASRFPGSAPFLLSPLPERRDLVPLPLRHDGFVVGFHATHTHHHEHRWLVPIVREVLARCPNVTFHITANRSTARLWTGDERVRVMPVLPWPVYRSTTHLHPIDVMLAPLLPNRVNLVRSPTKRIDAARNGAALLTSDATVYLSSPEEIAAGMVVRLEPAAWATTISALAQDPDRVQRLAALNRDVLLRMQREAQPLFRKLSAKTSAVHWSLNESLRLARAVPSQGVVGIEGGVSKIERGAI
jgi:hypothetical protein